MEGILGKKLGMTQIYEKGAVVPVTVVKAGPCLVVQRKTTGKDGYEAVQLGLVEDRPAKRVRKPAMGRFQKAGIPPVKRLAEFRFGDGEDPKPGDEVKASIFAENDYVDVVGVGKGKGFQGVIKRHGFGGGRATHGSMFHRAPGSIGASSFPSRVVKGMRAAGRMGGERVTTRNVKVLKVDTDNHLLLVEGSVPGSPTSYVVIRKAVAAKPEPKPQVEKPKKGKK
jgi:large subunit ribosomal protein L3